MVLVTSREVARALKLHRLGLLGAAVAWLLMWLFRLTRINRIYRRIGRLSAGAFIDALLKELHIRFELPEEDLKRIPKSGPFILIANHPLGGIDGVLLLKILLERRPDFKVIGNFLLQRVVPLKPCILPVNPFENHKGAASSIKGFKTAIRHLENGYAIGMFPAGEVSTHRENGRITDRPWEPAAIKLVKKAGVPVVPVYFKAKNSPLFYRLARISKTLQTAKLPSEILSQGQRPVGMRIGTPVSLADQQEHGSIKSLSAFLRQKTYMLANTFEKKRLLRNIAGRFKRPRLPKKIAVAQDTTLLKKEIERLRSSDKRLLESKNYEVFLAAAESIPHTLQELGRLREITFREVGEGTNRPIDLDEFDAYYHHLFLWDNEAEKIAGAYRMGLGAHIFSTYGISGFYIQKLFRIEPELYPMMSKAIEMGRAFIVGEYQQKPMPLFLLWKGIVHTTLRFPEHEYLIGGVSISNRFSQFSKSLMIEFMKSNYYDPYVAQYVHPKKEFKVRLKDTDKDFVFDHTRADLNKFDKVIDELEPGNMRLPVLIKKYIKQNARVVAFNVDPLFNNAIDGLMYIHIADLPESTVKPVLEEFQAELEKKIAGESQATTIH